MQTMDLTLIYYSIFYVLGAHGWATGNLMVQIIWKRRQNLLISDEFEQLCGERQTALNWHWTYIIILLYFIYAWCTRIDKLTGKNRPENKNSWRTTGSNGFAASDDLELTLKSGSWLWWWWWWWLWCGYGWRMDALDDWKDDRRDRRSSRL